MDKLRSIEFYKDYFTKFYLNLPKEVQRKYEYVFVVIRQADKIPNKFLKKITTSEKLYEIRIESNSNTYRTFCCFEGNKIIILFNSFQKKSQKTPRNQLKRAESIMQEYLDER